LTTIAYRDGVLAADTQTCRGYTKIVGLTKVARGPDGRMGGAAGEAGFLTKWLAWICGDVEDQPEPRATETSTDVGLLVHPDGTVEIFEEAGSYRLSVPYFAVGSGRDQALGAMFAGADAETAVRAAIAHDTGSGGPVTVLHREA
jgi:ATP-dependent HslUV protease subunit HslV